MARDGSSCDEACLYLTDLSTRDTKWDIAKPQTQTVANIYAGTQFDRYYERMSECSGWLSFALVPLDSGDVIHRLQSARLCHVRHCPICQWRKSLMWRAKVFAALKRIINDYPGKRFVYLTLTAKNCEVEQLGDTLTWMNESWQRLSQRKEFPALGWLRAVEVTRGKDGSAHPHFHALLMVNSNYFKKHYISQKRWRELWAESLRVDYDPYVDVKVVKPRGKANITDTSESQGSDSQCSIQPMDEGLVAAIRYTLKYSTKPDDFLSTDTSVSQGSEECQKFKEWLVAITSQLHRRRQISLGGIFKEYMSENDPENLIANGDSLDTEDRETMDSDPRASYFWHDEESRYTLAV